MSLLSSEIAQSCPALASKLSLPNPDDSSDSQLMGELASCVVDSFEKGEIEEIPAAFQLVERLIANGSESDRHAATIGFLETVQNVASHRKFGCQAFEPFLGPASQKAWSELLEMWKGKSSLAEVVASETGATLGPKWWQFWKRRRNLTPKEMLDQVENAELRKIIEQITRE